MMRTRLSGLRFAALILTLTAGPSVAADQTINTGGANNFVDPNRTINVGDKVTWMNTGGGVHNVRSEDAGFRNGSPSSSVWSFTFTFNTAGSFVYYCEAHGGPSFGMRGTITVQGGGGGSPGEIRFSAANYNIGEGGGNVTLIFQRVNGDDGAVSAQYATSNGSATAGSDYTAKSGTVNWADNDDTNKSVSVQILNDGAQESTESFNVTLSAPGGGATLGSPSSATVTISDNDGGGGNAPAAPEELAAQAQSTTQVRLTWKDKSNNETGFEIDVRGGTGTGGTFLQVGTAGANAQQATIGGLDPANYYTFRVRATNAAGDSANSNLASATTDTTPSNCIDDDNTMCLNGDRFKVEVTFETPPPVQTGNGHRVELTPDTGYFWFFNASNVEMVVKVLNACPFSQHYWVFAGGLTNVRTVITVTDTDTGKARTYINPQNTPFQPIQDTAAFATCP